MSIGVCMSIPDLSDRDETPNGLFNHRTRVFYRRTVDSIWLSSSQTGERLGVSLRTVYSFINDGILPAYRFGRVIRIRVDDVDAFIEESLIRPETK